MKELTNEDSKEHTDDEEEQGKDLISILLFCTVLHIHSSQSYIWWKAVLIKVVYTIQESLLLDSYKKAKHVFIKSLRHKLMTLCFITKDVISSRHIQQMSNIPTLPNMNRKWNTLLVMWLCNILLYAMLQWFYSTFIPTFIFMLNKYTNGKCKANIFYLTG